MRISEIRTIAASRGIHTGTAGKTDLIRMIQLHEGFAACFATGQAETCLQESCLWRGDCAGHQAKKEAACHAPST